MIEAHYNAKFSVKERVEDAGLDKPTYSEVASDIGCMMQPISYPRTAFHRQRAVNYNYSLLTTTDVSIKDDSKIVIDGKEYWYCGGKRQPYPFFTYQFFIGEYLE